MYTVKLYRVAVIQYTININTETTILMLNSIYNACAAITHLHVILFVILCQSGFPVTYGYHRDN